MIFGDDIASLFYKQTLIEVYRALHRNSSEQAGPIAHAMFDAKRQPT
jgi:hypothetical protein